jgi:hypothetical protein
METGGLTDKVFGLPMVAVLNLECCHMCQYILDQALLSVHREINKENRVALIHQAELDLKNNTQMPVVEETGAIPEIKFG